MCNFAVLLIIIGMKTIKELKEEQYDAKAKLHELIEFTNSEEFYTLTQSEKNLVGQRRIAIEMYLNSLTKNIYDKEGSSYDISSAMWPLMMSSMFTSSAFNSPSIDSLKEQLEDNTKQEEDESGCSD
jgi:hypothetical protein